MALVLPMLSKHFGDYVVLPLDTSHMKKKVVWEYHLKPPKSQSRVMTKPPVMHCKWSWKADAGQEDDEEQKEDEEPADSGGRKPKRGA